MKFLLAAPSLGASSVGRENNINLIRLSAAVAVVISHSALITAGRDAMPPLMWLLGSIAVWVFFSLSGFLIARSFERASSSIDYCAARVLRIFPALAACVVVTALVLGPMVTSEPLSGYLVSSELWRFLFGNLTLFWESRALPGVFKDHPVDHAQITFWTLKFELICYIGVLLLGTLGAFRNRILFVAFAASFVLFWALAVYAVETGDNSTGVLPKPLYSFLKVGIYFVLGMIAYVFRDHIRLNAIAAVTLVILLLALWWTPLFHALMPLAIVYTTFWFAFVPKGRLLMFNWLGDYSYGIYVFAVPIQQLCLTLAGPQTASVNFAMALVPTLILAILSWHFLESRCIESRRRLTGRLQGSGRRAITAT